MGFWIIIAAMTLAVIALLALSMRLGARTAPAAPGTSDLRVYQDQ